MILLFFIFCLILVVRFEFLVFKFEFFLFSNLNFGYEIQRKFEILQKD